MRQQFKDYNFKPESVRLIGIANTIIEEMDDEGYTLSLRQLYYQFVARDILPNSERSYKNLSKLITKAREAGEISWTAIEDRGRSCMAYGYEEDMSTIFESMEHFITYDLWERQDNYVEVWVEKDALTGVISKPCEALRVPYMACKGYLSASEAWRAGRRFKQKMREGKNCVLIHLGDHDPSGLDMTRDNGARLDLFAGYGVEVQRHALTMKQIERYKPPPNPAKFEDPRATDYIEQYGKVSWELDALSPKVIDKLITDAITPLINDPDSWKELLEEERQKREVLAAIPDYTDEIIEMVERLRNE